MPRIEQVQQHIRPVDDPQACDGRDHGQAGQGEERDRKQVRAVIAEGTPEDDAAEIEQDGVAAEQEERIGLKTHQWLGQRRTPDRLRRPPEPGCHGDAQQGVECQPQRLVHLRKQDALDADRQEDSGHDRKADGKRPRHAIDPCFVAG